MNPNLIYPPCVICDYSGDDFKLVHKFEELSLVRCPNDGLVFFHPNVNLERHGQFLSKDFWVAPAFQKAQTVGGYSFDIYKKLLDAKPQIIGYPDYLERQHLEAKVSWGRRALQWFKLHASEVKLHTVIDIGCATGHMLEGFLSIGGFKKAYGVDVCPWIIEQGKRLLKSFVDQGSLKLIAGEVWNVECPDSLDCVILWDSIEHIQELEKAFTWIKSHTHSGSLMIIHTPDVNKAEGPNWYLWSPCQHCWFFSKDTLSLFLKKYEFNFVAEYTSPEVGEMLLMYRRE